jgi:hypothetical protein
VIQYLNICCIGQAEDNILAIFDEVGSKNTVFGDHVCL